MLKVLKMKGSLKKFKTSEGYGESFTIVKDNTILREYYSLQLNLSQNESEQF